MSDRWWDHKIDPGAGALLDPETVALGLRKLLEPPSGEVPIRWWLTGAEYQRVRDGGEGTTPSGIGFEMDLGLTERARRWRQGGA